MRRDRSPRRRMPRAGGSSPPTRRLAPDASASPLRRGRRAVRMRNPSTSITTTWSGRRARNLSRTPSVPGARDCEGAPILPVIGTRAPQGGPGHRQRSDPCRRSRPAQTIPRFGSAVAFAPSLATGGVADRYGTIGRLHPGVRSTRVLVSAAGTLATGHDRSLALSRSRTRLGEFARDRLFVEPPSSRRLSPGSAAGLPGAGITVPPFCEPTGSVKYTSNLHPPAEEPGRDEMRILFVGRRRFATLRILARVSGPRASAQDASRVGRTPAANGASSISRRR
jgi:hypothetical protein